MSKVKLISPSNVFFDFNLKQLILMLFVGLSCGFIVCFVPQYLPLNIETNYRLVLFLTILAIIFISLKFNFDRNLFLMGSILIVTWNNQDWSYYLIPLFGLLFMFLTWLSQVVKFKYFFGILLISTIILRIIIGM